VRALSLSRGAVVGLLAGAFVCKRARRPLALCVCRVLVCVCTQTTKIERPFYCFANDDNARKDKPAAAAAAATDPSSHKTASVAKTVYKTRPIADDPSPPFASHGRCCRAVSPIQSVVYTLLLIFRYHRL